MDCKDLQFSLIKFMVCQKSVVNLKRMSYEKDHLILIIIMFCSANLMGQVTYTVTVPNGTNACFIAGEMTGWNQIANDSTKVPMYLPLLFHMQLLHNNISIAVWTGLEFYRNECWRWKCQ